MRSLLVLNSRLMYRKTVDSGSEVQLPISLFLVSGSHGACIVGLQLLNASGFCYEWLPTVNLFSTTFQVRQDRNIESIGQSTMSVPVQELSVPNFSLFNIMCNRSRSMENYLIPTARILSCFYHGLLLWLLN